MRWIAVSAFWILHVAFASALAQLTPAPPVEGASPPPVTDIVGPPAGQGRSGAALEAETKRVASLLRCPVCQGLSVFDSPAEMARNMKGQVGDLLARGYSEEQVLRYFESSYGEFVRLEPQRRGINWVVWLAMPAGLLAGGLLVLRTLRRKSVPADSAKAAPGGPDQSLEPYLQMARQLANPADSRDAMKDGK